MEKDNNQSTPGSGNKDINPTGGKLSFIGTNGLAQAANHKAQQQDHFARSHQKAEKLSTAVYLVTSFLSDNEPMKWRLRTLGLDVLNNISTLRSGLPFEREQAMGNATRAVHDALSIIEISATTGMLSEMNYRILKDEYARLLRDVRENDHAHSPESFSLSDSFFMQKMQKEEQGNMAGNNVLLSPRSDESAAAKNISDILEHHAAVVSKGRQDKGHDDVFYKMSLTTPVKSGRPEISKTRSQPIRKAPAPAAVRTNTPRPAGKRSETVLALFKRGGELTVKDVARALVGVSEKTAQRELASLVEAGTLKRTGERRWSTYSLR